jgi:TPR repeat protein
MTPPRHGTVRPGVDEFIIKTLIRYRSRRRAFNPTSQLPKLNEAPMYGPVSAIAIGAMFVRLAIAIALIFAMLSTRVEAGSTDAAREAYVAGRHAEAVRQLVPLAEAGDPDAETFLGELYLLGQGVERRVDVAAGWFKRAAARGQPFAQFNLGLMLLNGDGTDRDVVEAGRWLKASADKGMVPAMTQLGLMYVRGLHFPRNAVEAARLFSTAAELGDTEAQNQFGILLATGDGVDKNMIKAYTWFVLAERGGQSAAGGNVRLAASSMTEEEIKKAQDAADRWRSPVPAPRP